MGILSRARDILSSNINALMDKAEDPSKMVDEYLRQAKTDLAQVRQETAGVMADEKGAQREVDRLRNLVDEDNTRAQKALKAGAEDDAKVFIKRKQDNSSILVEAEKNLALAADNSEKMRNLHNKLAADIQELERRKNLIKSKAKVAKAQQTVNKFGTNSTKHGGAMGRMSDMEARVDANLDKALAEAELNEGRADEASALEAKYDGSNSASVDDELERMKAELAESSES